MHNPECSAVRSLRRTVTTTNSEVFFFPDEIVIDIISRLPAKTALRCRCVCRRWRDLTWTRDFLDLHLSRGAGVPMIVFQRTKSKLFSFCNWWNHARLMTWLDPARPTTHEFRINWPPDMRYHSNDYYLRHCNDGIMFLEEHSRSFIVLNPIYGSDEYVRISFARELSECYMEQVFFHPSLKEYCMLWRLPEEVDYRMLNLGPNPCWRKISNPYKHNPKYGFIPVNHHPIYVDGYLYWTVEKNEYFEIVEFDVKTEVYTHIPLHVKWQIMDKLKIHNLLSLVEVSSSEKIVHVNFWTLTDRALKYWTNYSYNINLEVSPDNERLEAVAVRDGELFLHVDGEQFVCNLKTGTATKTTVFTRFAKEEEDNLFLFCFPHAMSLDSLKNCKSKIFMNKEGLKPWRVVKDNHFRFRYSSPCSDDSYEDGSIPVTKKSLLRSGLEEETEEEEEEE